MSAAYPSSLPVAEITTLVDIVKHGQVASRASEFALNLWWCQGFAQSQIIGVPISQAAPPANFDAVTALEALVAPGPAAQLAIDWRAILKWALEELMKLLIAHYIPTTP